jgi:hypothetical protein
MRAIRVEDGRAHLVGVPAPVGEGVKLLVCWILAQFKEASRLGSFEQIPHKSPHNLGPSLEPSGKRERERRQLGHAERCRPVGEIGCNRAWHVT